MRTARKATTATTMAVLLLLLSAPAAFGASTRGSAASASGVSAYIGSPVGGGLLLPPTPYARVPDASARGKSEVRRAVVGPVRAPERGAALVSVEALSAYARRAGSPPSAFAESRVGHVALFEQAGAPLVEAGSLRAVSQARCARGSLSVGAAGSRFDGLTIAGDPVGTLPAPNTVVPILVNGLSVRLVLNEQTKTAAGLSVTMIHAIVSSALFPKVTIGEIRVGQAQASASCGSRAAGAGAAALGDGARAVGSSAARLGAAATPVGAADFAGSATGTVLHADAIQSGETRLLDTEVAFSGAALSSKGLASAIRNETQRIVAPASSGKNSYARGTGLEIGLVVTPTTDNQIILAGKAEASALPDGDVATNEIGPLPGSPAVYATLLRGQALANWDAIETCLLGGDVSRGLGFANDTQLLNAGSTNTDGTMQQPVLAVDAPGPERAVSQSVSRLFVSRQVDKDGKVLGPDFGLASEVRQTIAPVTFFKGGPSQFTIEVLGEWVLRASAGGIGGTAVVHYGPRDVTPETPILRIIQGDTVNTVLTFQQFFTSQGLVVKIPGVAEIAIGEDPRAIGGDDTTSPTTSSGGTEASAAVDVVRVKLLEQKSDGNVTFRASDLRLGHMEVSTRVPAGGLTCEIPVTKTPKPPSVRVGEEFTTTITVENPFECDLTKVRLVDAITTRLGARFAVVSSSPKADQVPGGQNLAGGTVIWNDIGPIATGKSKTVSLTLRAQGSGGEIRDIATATGVLSNCKGSGAAAVGSAAALEGVGLVGRSKELKVPVTAVLGKKLPATGVNDLMLLGLAFLAAAGAGAGTLRRAR